MNRGCVGMMLACLLAVSGEVAAGQAGTGPSPEVTEQLQAASRAFSAGKYRDAASAFKKANKLQGDSCYQCWLGMAAADLKIQDYKAALQAAEKAGGFAKDDSDRATVHNLKGNILSTSAHGAKDFAGAEEEYRAAT
jgi:tetratricopeptide (TPR) repeat protein